jgi:isoquinoline 1-oxidoreductase subunit beta
MNQILSRRTFIQASAAVGGGLMIGFHMPTAEAATIESKPWQTGPEGTEVNAWLAIAKDGTVTLRIPHTEMGQGGLTSVALLIAEELDVPWDKIKTVFADPNRHLRNNKEYKVMYTHGSQTVAVQHPHLMQAGASARERLKEAAAKAWGIERSAVEAKQGVLKAGNRTGTYAEFAEAAAKITLDKEPEIKKDPKQWWLLGKGAQRIDIPHKVNGSAQYSIDIRVPGMVYAAVKASPVPWGKVKSYNFDEELQLRCHQEPPRRDRRGGAEGGRRQARPARHAERRRGGSRQLVPRQDGARAHAHRVGLRRARQGLDPVLL